MCPCGHTRANTLPAGMPTHWPKRPKMGSRIGYNCKVPVDAGRSRLACYISCTGEDGRADGCRESPERGIARMQYKCRCGWTSEEEGYNEGEGEFVVGGGGRHDEARGQEFECSYK